MADMMQDIRNRLADALEDPSKFGGDTWAAGQAMIGSLAGVSLDDMSPEIALAEYPWLPKFLRTGAMPSPDNESDEEYEARQAAIAAREQRLAPLHDLNAERSVLVYQVADELGIAPNGDLTPAYSDPRVVALDAEIEAVKARALNFFPPV